jgi:cell division protein FtsB
MNAKQPQPPFWRRHLLEILGLALVAVAIHDLFGTHGYLAMRRTQREIEQLQGEIERLNKENEDLTKHVQQLRTDPDTIERIAREEMGLARPGEMIFRMPEPPTPETGSGSPTEDIGTP